MRYAETLADGTIVATVEVASYAPDGAPVSPLGVREQLAARAAAAGRRWVALAPDGAMPDHARHRYDPATGRFVVAPGAPAGGPPALADVAAVLPAPRGAP